MKLAVKSKYRKPCVALLNVYPGDMLMISGDTGNYDNLSQQDNVDYESRRGGWSSDNWMEETEE